MQISPSDLDLALKSGLPMRGMSSHTPLHTPKEHQACDPLHAQNIFVFISVRSGNLFQRLFSVNIPVNVKVMSI